MLVVAVPCILLWHKSSQTCCLNVSVRVSQKGHKNVSENMHTGNVDWVWFLSQQPNCNEGLGLTILADTLLLLWSSVTKEFRIILTLQW